MNNLSAISKYMESIPLQIGYNQPRGGYLTKFNTGRLRPEVQPLTLSYNILAEKVPHLYTFYWKKGTPFKYLL